MNARFLEIQEKIDHRNFDKESGDLYQDYYEACEKSKQSFFGLIDAKKEFFLLKVMSYPYSETELKTLKSSYKMIDGTYRSLELTIKLLKIAVGAYRKFM